MKRGLMTPAKMGAPHNANIDFTDFSKKMVLPDRIELSTSPLPRARLQWFIVLKFMLFVPFQNHSPRDFPRAADQ